MLQGSLLGREVLRLRWRLGGGTHIKCLGKGSPAKERATLSSQVGPVVITDRQKSGGGGGGQAHQDLQRQMVTDDIKSTIIRNYLCRLYKIICAIAFTFKRQFILPFFSLRTSQSHIK